MEFGFDQKHGNRTVPRGQGGRMTHDNCQALCTDCNLKKGADRWPMIPCQFGDVLR